MWFLLVSPFLAQAAAPPSPPEAVTVVREEEISSLDRIGSCVGNGRPYNLRRLMPLVDRDIEIDSRHGPLRVTLQGERLIIYSVGEEPGRAVFWSNIGNQVAPRDDLDVELKLAYFEGMLVLYWKETFQHRLYRQGMFRIEGGEVTFLCGGRGGIRTSH